MQCKIPKCCIKFIVLTYPYVILNIILLLNHKIILCSFFLVKLFFCYEFFYCKYVKLLNGVERQLLILYLYKAIPSIDDENLLYQQATNLI